MRVKERVGRGREGSGRGSGSGSEPLESHQAPPQSTSPHRKPFPSSPSPANPRSWSKSNLPHEARAPGHRHGRPADRSSACMYVGHRTKGASEFALGFFGCPCPLFVLERRWACRHADGRRCLWVGHMRMFWCALAIYVTSTRTRGNGVRARGAGAGRRARPREDLTNFLLLAQYTSRSFK